MENGDIRFRSITDYRNRSIRLSAVGRKPLFRPPVFIGIFHNPTLRKSGLIQGTITDYCTDGETEYRILFQQKADTVLAIVFQKDRF